MEIPQFPSLSLDQAAHFSKLAQKCIQVEFPNKLSHVMNDEAEVQSPKVIHPAFYGCFDWHSSVHGHWMLVRLLRTFPNLPDQAHIRHMLSANLTQENILQEVAYLSQPNRKSFERMYGWAWLLKLVEELDAWQDPDGTSWREHLKPLEELIVQRYLDFLPRQTYPIRTGLHPNTAFGLSFAWDYAVKTGHSELQSLIETVGKQYYQADQDCPGDWEPGGSDFLSPCLEEARLMRKILPQEEFRTWLKEFLPQMTQMEPKALFQPAFVADRGDPQIVHLDGLNLSRAWCMLDMATAFPQDHPLYGLLIRTAIEHLQTSLPHIASGNYEGEHWLASFAVYALSLQEEAT